MCVCVSALLLVFSHCKDVCPSLQKWCVPVHIQLCASTLLVVCSVHVVGGGGGGGGAFCHSEGQTNVVLACLWLALKPVWSILSLCVG